jgi:radical SAM protein with 4Fe4S-binding SPASM domain
MMEDGSLPQSGPKKPVAQEGFALGLGLTNECNLSCAFCYRDPTGIDRLTLEQVRAVMESLPVRSVNLGTGENGLHPKFREILAYLRTRPVKLTITSNGYSIALLSDQELRAFHDVEFSLDYAREQEQDRHRGVGNWTLIHAQAERCVRLGVPVTFIAVMMKANHLRLAEVAREARRFDAPLRVNVYQAVRNDLFALSYEEYWEGFRKLFSGCDAIAVGEPLVRAMAGLGPRTGGCGTTTVRVTPQGTVRPCVYWPGAGEPLSSLHSAREAIVDTPAFAEARSEPSACRQCVFHDSCRGGCAGRRRIQGALSQPDSYCPVVRGETRTIEVRMAPGRELPKSESACTTIVIAQ